MKKITVFNVLYFLVGAAGAILIAGVNLPSIGAKIANGASMSLVSSLLNSAVNSAFIVLAAACIASIAATHFYVRMQMKEMAVQEEEDLTWLQSVENARKARELWRR